MKEELIVSGWCFLLKQIIELIGWQLKEHRHIGPRRLWTSSPCFNAKRKSCPHSILLGKQRQLWQHKDEVATREEKAHARCKGQSNYLTPLTILCFVSIFCQILLIGTKSDLVGQEETHAVSTMEGVKLAKKIHALGYWETSAKTGEGIKEAFAAAMTALLTPDPTYMETMRNKCCCTVL